MLPSLILSLKLESHGSDDNLDRGIKFKYNAGGAKIGFFGLMIVRANLLLYQMLQIADNVFSGTAGTIAANLEGTATQATTVMGAAQSNITSIPNLATIGTITTGIWNATAISTAKGGTGLSSVGSSGQILVSNGSALAYQNIDGGTYS